MDSTIHLLFLAAAGGVLPALVWLFFWLREDKEHPEPRSLLTLTFLSGMLVVPIALPFEQMAEMFFAAGTFSIFFVWASIEELFKLGMCYVVALRKKEVDEPIDYVIYMITIALGFAALENILFIINPLLSGDILDTIVTGNLRFIGASLLHVISSAAIGVFLALAFYKKEAVKRIHLILGIIVAIVLHTGFNLFIISGIENNTIIAFSIVWIFIVALILFFEKIKTIYPFKKKLI